MKLSKYDILVVYIISGAVTYALLTLIITFLTKMTLR